jgi:hypothetical protein
MKVVGNRLGSHEGKLRISRVAASLCSVVALLVAGAVAAQQALTIEQNMDLQKKRVVAGKVLNAKGPNYEFCEVGTIMGTSKENAVVNAYNPTGIDHCSPAQAAEIAKDKEKIKKEMGAMDVVVNPSRHWTWDEFSVYQVGDDRQFGPVKMAWMGVEPLETLEKATFKGPLSPRPDLSRQYFQVQQGYAGLSARYAGWEGHGHAVLDQRRKQERDMGEPQGSRQPVQGAPVRLEVSHEGPRS